MSYKYGKIRQNALTDFSCVFCRCRHGASTISTNKRLLILGQERIPVSGSRNKRVLDGAGAGPADEVPQATGLVVGAAGAGATEGLHADHGSRGLVVHVVVAGCVAQLVVGNPLGLHAVAEEGTGEGVR